MKNLKDGKKIKILNQKGKSSYYQKRGKNSSKLNLKTEIIANECIVKFLKLILEGPKYLDPLSDGIVALSFETLASAPEKLLQVAFSLIILSTIDFGKQE